MIHIIIHMIIQFQWSTQFKWFQGWAVALKTEHFMLQSHITSRKDQNDYRMMAETNLTKDEAQTNAFKDLRCSPSLAGGLQPQSIYFSAAVYILLSITTFLLSLLPFKRNPPFTRRPNPCVVAWQQLTYWLVFLASLWWLLILCPWLTITEVFVDTQATPPSQQAIHFAEFLYWRWRP